MSKVIEKKILSEYFNRIKAGEKTYELRLADWECEQGDILVLIEIDPQTKSPTGHKMRRKVGYVGKTKGLDFWTVEEIAKNGYQIISLLDESPEIRIKDAGLFYENVSKHSHVQETKNSLLKYFAVMSVLCALLQIIIAIRGNHIDLVSQFLLAGIALYYAWYNYSSRNLLRQLRFGRLVSHLVGFLVVNVSYHLHAFILFASNNSAIKGDSEFTIDPSWFSVLFVMMTFWGLGLLIHLVASIANRGFEELPKE